jgi:L-asparaginase
MQIKIFTTGGTIDKTYFDKNSDYHIGEPQVDGILDKSNVVFDYTVQSILKKDSLDIDDADRQLIHDRVAEDSATHIIITHGTDSMVQTAKVLKGIADKTIVLTGSMSPALFRDSDAIFNIGGAVIAVQILPAGVYIVINGKVFDPQHVKKNVALKRYETT